MRDLVTVLMPAYNCANYIQESIDSILNQTFSDFKFLIIDDGSTDATKEVINSYPDPRIQFVNNPTNNGYIHCLNQGIEMISSKYIVRMDADDISLPQRLEKQIEFMEKNSNIAVCGCGKINFLDGHPETETEVFNITDSRELLFSSIFNTSIPHPSAIIRRSILSQNNIKYNEHYYYAEDKAMWLDLSKFGDLANLPEYLIKYRLHKNQVSTTKHLMQRNNSLEKTKLALNDYGIDLAQEEMDALHFICYPQCCTSLKDLYQVESLINKMIYFFKISNQFDIQFVENFLFNRLLMNVTWSTPIGLEIIGFIKGSKFLNLNMFDVKFFVKSILKRKTRGLFP
ncbi:glycosyltransferase family 2 protein [Litoribacter ruber]|uniref:glycosyltransferase family 2 protein n=1 Tax=Litoribacter ruber TaxID=702568 RepID=UPI001BD9A656|nr:glycosyltransferase family 2 protein [Litoribacter ruber]MBT0810638.1 glycosyltransferase family 2 protein [Litoribacter ruber]